MPRAGVLLTLSCLLVFAEQSARAAPGGKDLQKGLKKAEAVLSKLRRLEETNGQEGFVKAARRLYPELFAKVSALREGGLKTELTTAVVLYESSLRAARPGAKPDCARELRESYVRLCFETVAGGRAAFLRAKAALHVSRAEAELLYARGERGTATLDALALIRAERDTDRALISDALQSLKELIAASSSSDNARPTFDVAGRLEAVDRVLASLPRDRSCQLLREARDAFRDGLYWQLKAAPALALVIDASSYTPRGELPRLGLRADDATRTAQANLRAALKFISKAEELKP
ncbi:MAG: hypothetical protein ACJ754_09815 [Pyrinomonadaceae bacterium]